MNVSLQGGNIYYYSSHSLFSEKQRIEAKNTDPVSNLLCHQDFLLSQAHIPACTKPKLAGIINATRKDNSYNNKLIFSKRLLHTK